MTTTRVKYLVPGVLFPEDIVRDIDRRDPVVAAATAPASAFCFTFYDVEEAPDLGPDFNVQPVPKNESGRYYINADVLDYAAVEKLDGDHRILLSNMRGNHYDSVVRCRSGNFQPFTADDFLVDV